MRPSPLPVSLLLAGALLGGCSAVSLPLQQRLSLNVGGRPEEPPPDPVELGARTRAYNDLKCPQSSVTIRELERTTPVARVEVAACGHHMIYRCQRTYFHWRYRSEESESFCEEEATTTR